MAYDFFQDELGIDPATGLPKVAKVNVDNPQGYLSSIGTGALNGLQYVGGSLGKPQRAIAGTLGGNFRESLAAIPFSDYLGITDPKQAMGMRDVFRKWDDSLGTDFISDEDNWKNWAAGMAADIATDPLTYFGGKALTSAGEAASKVARPAGSLIRGGEAGAGKIATSKLAQEALAGGYLADTKAAQIAARQADLFEFALPKWVNPNARIGIGSGPTAARIAEGASDLAEKAFSLPGLKHVKGLVHAPSGSFVDKEMQDLSSEVYKPLVAEGIPQLAKMNREDIELLRSLGLEDKPWVHEYLRAYVENQPKALYRGSANEARQFAGQNPQGLADLKTMAKRWKAENAAMQPAKKKLGVLQSNFASDYDDLEYGARYANLPEFSNTASRKNFATGSGSNVQRRDALRNIPTNILQYISQNPKVAGDQALKSSRGARARYLQKKYIDPLGFQASDAKKYSRQLTKWAEGLDNSVLEKGFFSNSPLEDQAIRQMRELKSTAGVKARHAGLANYAVETSAPGVADPGYMLMPKALNKLGLTYNEKDIAGNVLSGAIPTQLNELARRFDNVGDINSFQVPIDVVKKINTPQKLHQLSTAEIPFGKTLAAVNNAVRAGVTYPWPGFHVRNKVSGLEQNWRAKAFDPNVQGLPIIRQIKSYLKPETDVNDLISSGYIKGLSNELPWLGATDQEASDALKNLVYDQGVFKHGVDQVDIPYQTGKVTPTDPRFVNPPMASKAIGKLVQLDPKGAWNEIKPNWGKIAESLKPFAEDVGGVMEPRWLPGRGRPMSEDFFVNKALHEGRKASNDMEFRNRVSPFLAYLKQGYDPAVAKQMVDDVHFDYSDISDFEKNMVRPLTSVGYTFARKNLPYNLRQLATDPARTAGMIRVGNNLWQLGGAGGMEEGEYDPTMDSYSKGFNIPLGSQYNYEGRPYQNYMSQLGLPEEEAFQRVNFRTDSWLPLDVKATGSEMLGLLSPLIAKPLELATGRQLYSGKRLEDLKPITGNTVVDQLLMGSPVSRVVTSGRTLMDDRKSALEKAANLLTGLRFTDVDLETSRKRQQRELMDKIGNDIPQVREWSRMYIPNDLKETLTPEDLVKWEAIQALYKQNAKESRQKKKAGLP